MYLLAYEIIWLNSTFVSNIFINKIYWIFGYNEKGHSFNIFENINFFFQ